MSVHNIVSAKIDRSLENFYFSHLGCSDLCRLGFFCKVPAVLVADITDFALSIITGVVGIITNHKSLKNFAVKQWDSYKSLPIHVFECFEKIYNIEALLKKEFCDYRIQGDFLVVKKKHEDCAYIYNLKIGLSRAVLKIPNIIFSSHCRFYKDKVVVKEDKILRVYSLRGFFPRLLYTHTIPCDLYYKKYEVYGNKLIVQVKIDTNLNSQDLNESDSDYKSRTEALREKFHCDDLEVYDFVDGSEHVIKDVNLFDVFRDKLLVFTKDKRLVERCFSNFKVEEASVSDVLKHDFCGDKLLIFKDNELTEYSQGEDSRVINDKTRKLSWEDDSSKLRLDRDEYEILQERSRGSWDKKVCDGKVVLGRDVVDLETYRLHDDVLIVEDLERKMLNICKKDNILFNFSCKERYYIADDFIFFKHLDSVNMLNLKTDKVVSSEILTKFGISGGHLLAVKGKDFLVYPGIDLRVDPHNLGDIGDVEYFQICGNKLVIGLKDRLLIYDVNNLSTRPQEYSAIPNITNCRVERSNLLVESNPLNLHVLRLS